VERALCNKNFQRKTARFRAGFSLANSAKTILEIRSAPTYFIVGSAVALHALRVSICLSVDECP
jgi:hypothetical protein